MDPSSGHQQMMGSSNSLESMIACSKTAQQKQQQQQQQQQQEEQNKKARAQAEQALNCPRCNSTNTKFCYYNNYSLSQPRYFCKSCRRYWTKGGTLRNVPVGGGCRKNKRPSSSSSSSKIRTQDQSQAYAIGTNPLTHFPYDHNHSSDFSLLALATLQKQQGQLGNFDGENDFSINPTRSTNTITPNCDNILGLNNLNSSTNGLLDALRNGFLGTNTNNNNMGLYYGYGNGDMGEVLENDEGGNKSKVVNMPYDQEMNSASVATTHAVSVTTTKQELCNGNGGGTSDNINRVLWGFPWQVNGVDTNMGEVDYSAARASWNNGLNWHGLLNSPLM